MPWPTHQFLFLLALFHFHVTEHIQHTRLQLGMEDSEMDEKPTQSFKTLTRIITQIHPGPSIRGAGETSQTVKRGYFSGSWTKWRLICFTSIMFGKV